MPTTEAQFQKEIENEIQHMWVAGEYVGNIAKEIIRKVRAYDRSIALKKS